MNYYPPKINDRINRASCAGRAADANAVGAGASLECGAFVRFFLRIDRETKRIEEAKYKSSGCGYAIAAAESLCARVAGERLNDLRGLNERALIDAIEGELGAFPASRARCAQICIDALAAAFLDFRRAQIEEFAGEEALICTCFGVSERTIENAIANQSLETVAEVTDVCAAGGGCGSCQPLIQEILDSYRRENV